MEIIKINFREKAVKEQYEARDLSDFQVSEAHLSEAYLSEGDSFEFPTE
jgi:hypothetical protein